MKVLQVAARVLQRPVESLQAERIKGGLTNDSWRVSVRDAANTADAAVVVRLSHPDELTLQLNRRSEAVVLQLVEAAGIGAPVLCCEPDQQVLVTRYLGVPTMNQADLHDPAMISAVAALLRRLHALVIPAPLLTQIQVVDLRTILQGYWRSLAMHGEVVSADERDQALIIADESVRSLPRSLCHNDVHHLNLLGDASRLWLLDWEYAGLGDPWFDLASVCVYHELGASQRHALLLAYGGEAAVAQAQRLERLCWLFDYLRSVWLRVRAQANPC